MSGPATLAFVAGAAAAVVGVEVVAAVFRALARRAPGLAAALAETIARVGREGRDPGAAERRRLLGVAGAAAFVAGVVFVGPLGGVVVGVCAPWVAARALRARRERHRQAVAAGAAAIAVALADALGGGHSLRGAVGEAARGGVPGAAGRELRRLAGELALGSPTDEALEAFRVRVGSQQIDTLVAACLLQRRAGGDLARLLRECARAFEDQTRLIDEAHAATAQARFTGLVVVLLPLGGALLAELASPGYLRGLAGSFLTLWLGGLALVLQVVAAVAIRRLARVRA
ncbi:MAG TPA: type II secretion system F family protein [Thermoleophilaceae bacterium]|jgi:tight adherence protein B